MARTRLGTRVGLVEGRGEHLWLRIGRIVAAACSRTWAQRADACASRGGGARCRLPSMTLPELTWFGVVTTRRAGRYELRPYAGERGSRSQSWVVLVRRVATWDVTALRRDRSRRRCVSVRLRFIGG